MADFNQFLIATDLDGTFLAHGGKMHPQNMKEAKNFQKEGGLFTVATGRLQLNLRSCIGEPKKLLNLPAVVCNGAFLYNYQTDEIVAPDFLSKEEVDDLLLFLRKDCADVQFRVSAPHEQRTEEISGYIAADNTTYNEGAMIASKPAENWPRNDWFKIVLRDTHEKLLQVREKYEKRFGDRFGCFFTGSTLLEIQKKGIDKGTGIDKLRRFVPGRRIVVMGDYENDIPMLKKADIAACPENAIESVKQICPYRLPDCDAGVMAPMLDILHKL